MNKAVQMKEDRSIGELFSELANETSTLIRQEVALAQTEMTAKLTTAGKNAAFVAAGGAVGFAAFLTLLGAVVAGLSYFMPIWLSALIVAVVVGAVAFYLISSSLAALKGANLAPNETVSTLKEDARWLKNQVS
jgi:Putative Actinobacterial Holin-X, holin superfamily III